jgi:uncharacterized protein (DUF1015 family)
LYSVEGLGILIWPVRRVIEAPTDLESKIEKYFDVNPSKDFYRVSKKEIRSVMIFKDGRY